MKRIVALVVVISIFFCFRINSFAESKEKSEAEYASLSSGVDFDLEYDLGGAYLCEATTGKVLYAENEFKAASPASVTKIMTLLLVCEAIDSGRIGLGDVVTVSQKAASMGGSQVFLEEGERITVEELIKSTVIASGNDASVALAELCAGSEAAFVKQMNSRAIELGLKNTHFENTTGLDDTTTNHYSCAADIAKMSRELIKHEIILKYASIWQDTIRNGEFTLTNTNRLVRYYDGCNGLKTGSTDKAGYCISATAKRGNMQLVAVIMGAKTKDERNAAAKSLLDFGFANFALYEVGEKYIENIPVRSGKVDSLALYSEPFSIVVGKSDINKICLIYEIPDFASAPIIKGSEMGKIKYLIGDEQIGQSQIYAECDVLKINFGEILFRILKRIING